MTFKDTYFDFVVIVLTLLLTLIVSTIISIIVSGSRTDGMVIGLYIGLGIGLLIFYLLRTQFDLLWTSIQLVINAALTIGEFMGFAFLTKDTVFFEMNYGYFAIIVTIPILISLNKFLMDYMLIKQNVKRRKRRLTM